MAAATITLTIPVDSDPWEYEKRLTGMVAVEGEQVIITNAFSVGGSKIKIGTNRPIVAVLEEIYDAVGCVDTEIAFK